MKYICIVVYQKKLKLRLLVEHPMENLKEFLESPGEFSGGLFWKDY